MAKLDGDAIARALETLPGWRHERGALVRSVEPPSYRAAQRFVNRMVDLAEGANHHPDLSWSYGQLTISLTTHDRGGVTRRDLRLAALFDEVLVDLGWPESGGVEHGEGERDGAELGGAKLDGKRR
jgi:4a-hydroxytetrahydrobiopterin dehydratase